MEVEEVEYYSQEEFLGLVLLGFNAFPGKFVESHG